MTSSLHLPRQAAVFAAVFLCGTVRAAHQTDSAPQPGIAFDIVSVANGDWSNPDTWQPARVPGEGDRVLVSRGTHVTYDVESEAVLRVIQVVGTLEFARDRNTLLNVGLLKVQNSDTCSESGFACDFHGVTASGEPHERPEGDIPALLVGTPGSPIPAEFTATIRLHYLNGMPENDSPALACCAARMEIHGAPMSRTWVKLGADSAEGATQVTLTEPVTGWNVGDDVIVTGSVRRERGGSYRTDTEAVTTEERRIVAIDRTTITLDEPLDFEHSGSGEFKCEIANLSRNVVIESADPEGQRGHTVYHAFSAGGISYARLAHLGKEGVLGRYAIHFHMAGDTMRGGGVVGAAIVDSHNRWVTIHGTNHLVIRDCVGYGSVGHGYFLEDGTEVYNLLDRNLAVHAYAGRPLPNQVLSFDPNDGAGFWWANGRNTFTRNVSCENDEYGYRYDIQERSNFDPRLPVLQPDGTYQTVDVRTIPIWRFEQNEAHTEGFYGMLVAANGNDQPDSPIDGDDMLRSINEVDWTGPDERHPHIIRDFTVWGAHYAFRPHSPCMLMEDIRLHDAAYGVYRPAFESQVYRDLHISKMATEPFNRGMDDASAQTGIVTVDGLILENGYGNDTTPFIQISDNNLSGKAATHIRGLEVRREADFEDRWPLINRGVGTREPPVTEKGVPIFIHDHFGPGRHLEVVSTLDPGYSESEYEAVATITSDESRAREVADVEFPEPLDPIDDLPPATIVILVTRDGDALRVVGVSHDNGEIDAVVVNGLPATIESRNCGVVDWSIDLPAGDDATITAFGIDQSGNVEQTAHVLSHP
jgi:hypothetical protein